MIDAVRYFSPAPPRVLAHRGLAIEAPENTLLAFLTALARGVTHIETDVRASLDGVAVISHDADLGRVANRDERVDQLTASELQRVELGQRQGVPTLAEALDAFPDARFNIDIKSADAVLPVVHAVSRANAAHRVLVTSFASGRARRAARMLPGVVTSASSGRIAVLLVAVALRLRPIAGLLLRDIQAIQIPERYRGIPVLSTRLITSAHASRIEVHVWTINEVRDMRRLLEMGVDGIVTDRADLALEVLGSTATS